MIKVMIVEDDPMVSDINKQFLLKVGDFNVCGITGNIEEAKVLALEKRPRLVLLDIFLPGGSGLEFLKWLRMEDIECDVILITADKSCEALQQSLRYGAVDYLIKPFTFERFKEALLKYRKRIEKVSNAFELQQDTIDKYILNSNSTHQEKQEGELIKGLNRNTYEQIWDYIKESSAEEFTAEEVADGLGMARVTVRRYLEYMTKEHKLFLEMEYGKVGRPSHIYKL